MVSILFLYTTVIQPNLGEVVSFPPSSAPGRGLKGGRARRLQGSTEPVRPTVRPHEAKKRIGLETNRDMEKTSQTSMANIINLQANVSNYFDFSLSLPLSISLCDFHVRCPPGRPNHPKPTERLTNVCLSIPYMILHDLTTSYQIHILYLYYIGKHIKDHHPI